MKNYPKQVFIKSVLAMTAVFLLSSCTPGKTSGKAPFAVSTLGELEQVSTGKLGRVDPVILRFASPIAAPEAVEKAATFRPKIKGEWKTRDDRTVEFTPASPYKSGLEFTLTVDSGLLKGQKEGTEGFALNFTVRPSQYEVIPDGLYSDDTNSGGFTFSGLLTTDIPVTPDKAHEMVSARLGPKNSPSPVAIQWTTNEKSDAHRFVIKPINRSDAEQFLSIEWKGGPIGSKFTGSKSWLVPAKADFKVLEIAADDPSCILVRFSDRLDPSQDIRGLIRADNANGIRYNLDGNVLKLYNTEGWKADSEITVLEGIKNLSGKTLMHEAAGRVSSAWDIPEVRFANDGIILPPTNGVTVAIETKNLTGLIIEAYKIHGDNILQFLQVNELDGSYEMRRVGEPVWTSSFDFNWDDGMKNRFVPRGLDLSALLKKNPGGMIQLRLTFRKRHIMYECTANHDDFSALPMPSDEITVDKVSEYSYWDYFNDMDWKERNRYWTYRGDPCHPAFYLSNYNSGILVRKNVLVSNLGIMNKLDSDGTYHVAVADIAGAQPVANAEVTLYTFAQKKIASVKTDKQGFANLKGTGEPYFITAEKDGQISWLRIESGTSLSVSHFEVEGEKAEKGIKGFIYGERGVWRPGDDIHLVFVLQDLKKQLPADFPVTFELQDPMGRIARTAVYSNPVDGFYRIDTGTSAEDPTGPWIARIKAGGQKWTRSLKIENVVPNRLAVSLKASKAYLSARNNSFTLTGAWLHGAPAPGLKADVSVMFSPGTTAFDGFADYTFINPERTVESNREIVWEGNLGPNSEARFNLDFEAGASLPGKLNAQIITRVFEPSLMFSTEQVGYEFSPYERYVGIRLPKGDASRGMLLTDTKHKMDIALLTAEGKPAGESVSVSVAVYKLQWRWWWEKEALTDATYAEGRSATLISSGTVQVKNGKGSWDFEIKYPEWGRYLVVAEDKNGGHSAAKIVYVDWPGWAGRGKEAGSGSAAMLTLKPDKALYVTGETALVSFGSGTGGRALVSVEKDGLILAQDWLDTAAGTTVYRLPVTAAMAPNVYVHITMLQKHMQTANSLPIRLYGVIPLMVENPATRLSPAVSAPVQYEPGKKASLTVTETSGRPMTFTVAVVDEGLLGLTRFTAPNPWKEFYKKEASRLASWDLYRYVMSAFGGKLETLLSIGGSEEALNANNKKAQRFKPVVLFFGPYELPAKGKTDIDFEMPQYVGAVRIMVVAGKNGAYGTAEKTVVVKSDLMVQATLPRTLGVNETIEVPVTLFNGKETPQTVTVNLSSEGAVKASLSEKVELPAQSDRTVSFRLATDIAGKAVIKTTAGPPGGAVTAESVTEIDILSRGSPLTTSKKFTLAPGAKYRDYMPSPGEKNTKTMSVELATLPVLDLQTRMQYLTGYPHGCIEQITSGAFPQLFIADLVETGADDTERIKKNVMSVIERYQKYQTAAGGFAYWTGGKEESLWGTSYAGHFMAEARKAGYEIPDSLFKPWLAFQQSTARSWQKDGKNNDDATQAYRLYTLALSGYPELGGMNRLQGLSYLSDNARWLLAGTYAISGHRETAAELTRNADLSPSLYRETGNTWGSNFRDSAIVLNTLTAMGDTQRAADMIPVVAETFGSDRWFSTQETSWMLLSLAPHYKKYDSSPATYSVEWDKGTVSGEIRRSAVIQKLEPFESPTQTLVIDNTGSKNIYGKVTTRGLISAGKETKLEKGLGLTVQYLDQRDRNVQPSSLAPGDSFTVKIGVTNMTRSAVDNIALSLPVPTCWEFTNERLGTDAERESTKTNEDDDIKPKAPKLFDYQDIKDTNIFTYFGLKQNETKIFVFHATVAYNGNYYIPAVRAEAMYDAEYQAILPGQAVRRISGAGAP